jgi:hypothetical protein
MILQNVQYVNDLIAYYLDTVLSVLETSETARSTLSQSYESYRALRPPKPTYHQFITDNATGKSGGTIACVFFSCLAAVMALDLRMTRCHTGSH